MFDQNPIQPAGSFTSEQPKTAPLANQPSASQTPPPRVPQVEDMFLETDQNTTARISRPFVSGQASQMPMSGEVFGGRSFGDNKILVAIIALAVLALVGVGVWLAVSFFSAKISDNNSDASLNTNTATNTGVNNQANQTTNVNTNATTEINANTNTTSETAALVDSDNDGLSDEEEKQLGTDSNNFDTDSDGLVDRVEVKIYKTNPLQKDTDGDGFNDGQEVISGFDPAKGGGAKLLKVP